MIEPFLGKVKGLARNITQNKTPLFATLFAKYSDLKPFFYQIQ